MDDRKAEVVNLLDRAKHGDEMAIHELLELYRDRLRKMLATRIGPKLSRRLDASDIIQDALMTAAKRLPTYVNERPIAFYPWLRKITEERFVDARRRHFAQKRSVEMEMELPLTDESISQLAHQFVGKNVAPPEAMAQREQLKLLESAIEQMPTIEREILAMKYLEGMSNAEVAEALGLTVPALKSRHSRAIGALHQKLFRRIRSQLER